MFEFEKLCREVEKIDPVTYALVVEQKSKDVIAKLALVTENGLSGLTIYTGLVVGAIISDGKISEEEFVLVKPMLDVAFERDFTLAEANALMKYFKAETKEYKQFIDAVADLFGEISDDLKADIVTVCLLICAVDGKVSFRERKWLKQLIR